MRSGQWVEVERNRLCKQSIGGQQVLPAALRQQVAGLQVQVLGFEVVGEALALDRTFA